MKSLVILHMRV